MSNQMPQACYSGHEGCFLRDSSICTPVVDLLCIFIANSNFDLSQVIESFAESADSHSHIFVILSTAQLADKNRSSEYPFFPFNKKSMN